MVGIFDVHGFFNTIIGLCRGLGLQGFAEFGIDFSLLVLRVVLLPNVNGRYWNPAIQLGGSILDEFDIGVSLLGFDGRSI